jgi:ABC-type uncharacterized transport system permease subunit
MPLDSQFILTFKNLHVSNVIRVAAALVIAYYALSQLHISPGFFTIILFAGQFLFQDLVLPVV